MIQLLTKEVFDKHLAESTQWQRHKLSQDDGVAINISGQNLDNIVKTGFYMGANVDNAPVPKHADNWIYLEVIRHDDKYILQKAYILNDSSRPHTMFVRTKMVGIWSTWSENIFTSVTHTTQDLTYYVDATNGNDNNNGLSPTTAFKTIQAAVDRLPTFIYHEILIKVADGNYNETVHLLGKYGRTGRIIFEGNLDNPNNCNVSNFVVSNTYLVCIIQGFNFTSTITHGVSIYSSVYAQVNKCNCTTESIRDVSGILGAYSNLETINCNVSNRYYGILAVGMSQIHIFNCSGSNNTYGLTASAGTIMKEGTVPTGLTNESIIGGGVIR